MNKRFKRLKRRFRKNLYHFLVTLSEFDFKKLRPVCIGLGFTALILVACLLPTTVRNNAASTESAHGSTLATSIRVAANDLSTLQHAADVVAVFLPEENTVSATGSYSEAFTDKTLYSFFVTGKELYTLAEGIAALKSDTQTLYLDGLNFTYHENRLPFDRVTELSLNTGSSIVADDTLYHVISTEEIFSLFHYIAYRSLGLTQVHPKSAEGTLLADYKEIIRQADAQPLTIASVLNYASVLPADIKIPEASVITTLGGYNLIELWKSPNKITILMVTLFFTMVVLVWYSIQKLQRVKLWVRIYHIRSKKRGRTVFYSRRNNSSRSYRRAG